MIKIGRRRLAERPAGRHRQAGACGLPGSRRQSGARHRHADRRAAGASRSTSSNKHFDPSNLEFTSIDIGNKTVNVIPAEAQARFNIRFNDEPRTRRCRRWSSSARPPAAEGKVQWRIEWEPSNADVFVHQAEPVCRSGYCVR